MNFFTKVSAVSTTNLDHLVRFVKKFKPFTNQDSDSKEKGFAIKNLIDKRLNEHGTSLKIPKKKKFLLIIISIA